MPELPPTSLPPACREFRRVLYHGQPPLVDPPPTVHAAPDYSVEVPR